MHKCTLIAIAFLNIFCVQAQNDFDIEFRNSTYVTDGELLPFWFTANRNGMIKADSRFLNVAELYAGQRKSKSSSSLKWSWGAHLAAGLSDKNYMQLNQAFAGISYKDWELKAGMFHDSIRFSGLSTTNGNLIRSLNARPYPLIRFSTGEFKTIPFTADLLSFNLHLQRRLTQRQSFCY
jgi:hypothetical protein